MMINQVVGKCLIFAGVFMLACVIMGGGQADAGCSNTACGGTCAGKKAPNCGTGTCTAGSLSCWNCDCKAGFAVVGAAECVCNL